MSERELSHSARGWQSVGPVVSHHVEDVTLVLECRPGTVRISLERDDIIRVRLAPQGKFGRDHSWAVVPNGVAKVSFGVEEYDDYLELNTPKLQVRISRDPCRISFYTRDGKFIAGDHSSKGMCWDGEEVRAYRILHANDHFFGMGEKCPPLDKRGQALVNWNYDAAEHEPFSDPLYQTHPFVIVLNEGAAHGIFFDNTHRTTFDFGKTSREAWSFGADAGELNYYFIPGDAPMDVIRRYGKLVGTSPLPPMWALGYQQCRWSYESAKRVAGIAREFRKRKIPCDAIYIDIDYMDGFRSFTWDKKRFAKHEKLLAGLKKDGFKIVVILDPGIKAEPGYRIYDEGIKGDHFLHDADKTIYVGKVWPGKSVFPDFTQSHTRHWWGGLYKEMLKQGVAGFWNDMNEPADFSHNDPEAGTKYANAEATIPLSVRFENEGQPSDHRECHNIYGMQMARSTYEGLQRLRPEERPFVLTRAGYCGVQRYAAVWTGDNASTWDHLRMSVPMLLNMSVSGMPLIGADIGGFRAFPSAELYTRWLQLGIFYPLMRTHTAGGKEQDPFSFGKKFEKLNREIIETRYILLPYIYTELQHACATCEPLLRPLFVDFPEMQRVHRSDYEFMFGRQLFVAPVLWEGATSRKFRLPEGKWYDFMDGTPYTGGQEVEAPGDIESIPVLARAGAVIPMRGPQQYVGEEPLWGLILKIFSGNGGGHFYHDDGATQAFNKGESFAEEYTTSLNDDRLTFQVMRREGSQEFAPPCYVLMFKAMEKAPASVMLSDKPIKQSRSKLGTRHKGVEPAWWYDKKMKQVWVFLPSISVGQTISICPIGSKPKSKKRRLK